MRRRVAAPCGRAAGTQVLRHLAEDPGLAAGLGALDGIPVAQHLLRIFHLGLAEDVGVAADELLGDVLGHLAEVPGAALLEQQRQEVDLKEHIAQLVEHLGVVALVGGVGQLVGLLERVGDDRALVLLAVPGALTPQPAGDLVKRRQGPRRVLWGGHRSGCGGGGSGA